MVDRMAAALLGVSWFGDAFGRLAQFLKIESSFFLPIFYEPAESVRPTDSLSLYFLLCLFFSRSLVCFHVF